MATAPIPPDEPFTMRSPCACGCASGYIRPANGQDVVRCAQCGRYAYCAPKAETGKRKLVLAERLGVKPSVRARILREWDHRCAFCGVEAHHTPEGGLHLAHLVDRQDAARYGLLDELIDDPLNLVPGCSACNLGEGKLGPRHIRLIVRFMVIAHAREQEGGRG